MTTHTGDQVLHALRPDLDPPPEVWAEAVLTRITTHDQEAAGVIGNRRIGRPRVIAGVALATVAISGGASYATGLVPQFVYDQFDEEGMWVGDGANGFKITNERPLVAVPLSDGVIYSVWRADNNAGGQCEVTSQGTDPSVYNAEGLSCWTWDAETETGRDPSRPIVLLSASGLPLIYGEAQLAAATKVEVIMDSDRVTVPIDPKTRGYGAELPSEALDERVFTVRFMADSDVLESRRLVP